MKRRIVSVLMVLVMVLSLLPVQALAEDAAVEEPVTEIEQVEEPGEGGEPEVPDDPEVPEEPEQEVEKVEQEVVKSEGTLTASAEPMGTAGETTEPGDFYIALVKGGTLTMQNDVDYGGSMSVGVNLTIDLNGYVLKMTGIKVENGGSLTITDSRSDAEHKFTPNADGLWVLDETNGTKTVKGGVIYGGTGSSIGTSVFGGGVYVEGGGTFIMKGGNIVGCTASTTFSVRGGGVFVADRGTFTMSGGSITGCTTVGGYSYGGGIYNEGTVTLSGTAEIRDCHAKHSSGEIAYGGGISDNGRASQISGNVRITGCTASGGKTDAVSMDTGSIISGGTFDGSVLNDGTISGGTFNGRVVNGGTISDGTFNGEVANEGTISGGTFNGVVTNYSTITEGAVSGIIVTYQVKGTDYATQIVPSGSTAIKPVAPPNSVGADFLGWYRADGTAYDFTQTVTENITLTAKFAAVIKKVTDESGLTAALADPNVDIVTLGSDVAISATLNITRAVTLDIYGYMLEMKGSGSVITIKDGGNLTLVDSDLTATYYFTPDANGLWKWGTSGTKTVNGGVIYGGNAENGGGVYIEPGGQFTMNGGSIVGCKANYRGGGVMADCDEAKGSRFTMNSGAIIGCVAKGHGGGVETQANAGNELQGAFIMNGGVIEHCVANQYGGILCSGSFTMNGGTIRYCRATEETDPAEQKGGVYLAGRGQNILNGTIISEDAVDTQYVFASAPVTIGADADIRANMYLNGYTIALADGVTSKTIYGKITNGSYADGLVAVTYQVNGKDYATQLVRSGNTATRPIDPTNSVGADFLGWYKADGTEYDFTQTVTENITLTAKFAAFTKTVANWSELQDALANADVDVVQLAADGISPWGNVARTLYVERAVTLDLNGYVLKGDGRSVFEIKNGGHLTVIDSNPTAEHRFRVNNNYSYGVWQWTSNGSGDKIAYGGIINGGYTSNGGGVKVLEGGKLTMNGGSIVGCGASDDGGGVYVCGGGVFEMNAGAAIIGCASHGGASYGGGVYVNGTFTMNGGTIRDCVARGWGGGGVASQGQFTMNGGTIESCTAGVTGGAVYHSSGAALTLNGTITSDNSSRGQPVYVQGRGDVTIGADANIQTNVYLSDRTVHANGGTVRGELCANWDIRVSVDEGVTSGTIFYGKLTGNCDYNIDGVAVSYKVNNEDYATQFLRSGGTATQPDTPTVPADLTFDGWLKADGTRWDFTTAMTENTTLMGWLYVPVTNETELRAALADDTVDVIRLTDDIAVDAILNVKHGRDVILDLNGYVLSLKNGSNTNVIAVTRASKLTIIDSRPNVEHKFTPNTNGLWVRDEASGTKTVKGGVITGGNSDAGFGGGISIAGGSTVIMEAGNIVGCSSDMHGGGVYVGSGSFTMTGSITGCVAKSMGGGVYVERGTFTMNGGSITDCTARDGGALYLCGTMNAGGGTVDGTVVLDRDSSKNGIIRDNNTGSTLFNGNVTNAGEIAHGIFNGTVTVGDGNASLGAINGGTFNGPVNMTDGTDGSIIEGGIFNDTVTIDRGQITNGTFNKDVVVKKTEGITTLPVLADGTYNGLIKNGHEEAAFIGAYSELGIVGKEPDSQSGNYSYYKVTFDLAGGKMDYTKRYFRDETHISDQIKPNDRAGYFFEGWYNGTELWDHAKDTVTGEMTLTAKWKECDHSGHTGVQPTCTTSVICTECGGTMPALGHDWGAWTSNGDNTHTHVCKRDASHTETKSCVDTDRDHICNDCGKTISNHEDVDKNHVCDYCGKTISNHEDVDKNHVCDYCGKTISNHEDADKNHVCDYCGKTISNHTGGTAYCNAAKVCGYCGKSYGDKDPANHANLVNVPAKAATTSAEGNIEYWYCDGCNKYYKDAAAQDEITQEDTVIAKRRAYTGPTIYPVRNGTNPSSGTEYPGGIYGLIYRATVSKITGVQVDGRTIGKANYTTEGSYPVELYLKASYLNRLARGSHTLTVLTDSGSLTAAFTVGDARTSPTTFDAGITVYAAAAVTSLTGLELLRRKRREEE